MAESENMWQSQILPTVLSKVRLLHTAFFAVLWIGFIYTALSLWSARKFGFVGELDTLFRGLYFTAILGSILLALIVLIRRLSGETVSKPEIAGGVTDRVKTFVESPVLLLDAGIFAVAIFGLAESLLTMWEIRAADAIGVWSIWSYDMLFLAVALVILVTLRTIALGNVRQSPSGAAADDKVEEAEGSQSANAAASTAAAESASPEAAGEAWQVRVARFLASPQQQLYAGIFVIAYLGALQIIVDMWDFHNESFSTVWPRFVLEMLQVVFGVGIAVAGLQIIRTMSGAKSGVTGEISRWQDKLSQMFADPLRAVDWVVISIAALAVLWWVLNLHSARFSGPALLWLSISRTTFDVLAIILVPLVIRAGLIAHARGGLGSTAGGQLLEDPDRLLKLGIYALAYVGILEIVLNMWVVRGISETGIWLTLLYGMAKVMTPIAIAVALRAVGEVVTNRPARRRRASA